MNYLSLDFGKKRIGTAIAIHGIVQPGPILSSTQNPLAHLKKLISDYKIGELVLGYTQSPNYSQILDFKSQIQTATGLLVHLADENVSTYEATQIVKNNRNYHKKYLKIPVDSAAAAVILSRFLGN